MPYSFASESAHVVAGMPIFTEMQTFHSTERITQALGNGSQVHMAGKRFKLDFPVVVIQVLQLFVGRRAIIALGDKGEFHVSWQHPPCRHTDHAFHPGVAVLLRPLPDLPVLPLAPEI